jgi:hypothetical protein
LRGHDRNKYVESKNDRESNENEEIEIYNYGGQCRILLARSPSGVGPVIGDKHKHADLGFVEIFEVHIADATEFKQVHTNDSVNIDDEYRKKTRTYFF